MVNHNVQPGAAAIFRDPSIVPVVHRLAPWDLNVLAEYQKYLTYFRNAITLH